MIKLIFFCISLSTVFAFTSPQSAAQATHEETVVQSNMQSRSSISVARLRGQGRIISVCSTATENLPRGLACRSFPRFSESFEIHVHASCADYAERVE